jgi:uncharacterized protein YhbP (UPF0306 family)
MSLATSIQGETWIAPLAYAYDEQFNFYWYSEKTARHSQHIELNQSVAVAIFNSEASSDEVDGLQIIGLATEVAPCDLPSSIFVNHSRMKRHVLDGVSLLNVLSVMHLNVSTGLSQLRYTNVTLKILQ